MHGLLPILGSIANSVISRPHVWQTGDFEPLSEPVGIAGACPSSKPALIPDYYGDWVV